MIRKVELGQTGELVSCMGLGTMYFGSKLDERTSFDMLDYYTEQGGILLDTANKYASWVPGFEGGESERVIGKWMRGRSNRPGLFITSKVGFPYGDIPRSLKKEIIISECEKSLERLGTGTIDLYFAHAPDPLTPVEETMEAFYRLKKEGKIRYAGASNYAAWQLCEARTAANLQEWEGFACIQQRHNYLEPVLRANFGAQLVTPVEENLQKLRSDTRRIGAMRIPEYHARKRMRADVAEVSDYYGCTWEMDPHRDLYYNQVTFPLKAFDSTSAGVSQLPRPDWEEYVKILRKDLSRQIEHVGDHCGIADRNTAGFTENSVRIRGYEEWYLDLLMDYEGVDRLINIILEDKLKYWDVVIDWLAEQDCLQKIQVISECDDLGSQSSTIIEPDALRKLVIPKMRTLFAHVRKRLPHVKIFFHCCGSIRPIIPDLIDAGVDILNPVQYKAANMDLKGLKKDFGKDLTFWGGGIDTQTILNSASEEEVRDEVKRVVDILAPGGGFVFAPVHNIQDDVSPDNFWAMWETLQEYGKY